MADMAWSRRNIVAGLEGAPLSVVRAQTYIVQSGDTLWEIAYERNLSVETLVKFNPSLDPDLIKPGQRVHLPSSDELLQEMRRKPAPPAPPPPPSLANADGAGDELLADEGDWPPVGSKAHKAIMRRHMRETPSPIVVVAGTVAVAVAIRTLARVLRKDGTPAPPSDEVTPVKPGSVRKTGPKPIKSVIGAVGKCAGFLKDTVGKLVVLETESGSLPPTPDQPQKPAAPAVFRSDPRHSAREEPTESSPSYSGGSAASEASGRSDASAAPSMADILLVVKRAGGGENLTVRSTTRDVATEIERALVRLARDKTREREKFDRNAATSARSKQARVTTSPPPLARAVPESTAAVAAVERLALQQELQAALQAVAAFKEAETIQAAMAAEANARCAALEITLAEERAKVARLLAEEKEKAREAAARHQPASFQSPPALVKTVPESPAMSEISTPVLEMGRLLLGSRVGDNSSPVACERPAARAAAAPAAANGGRYGDSNGGFGAESIQQQAEEKAAVIHAAAALKAMTAAVEALDAAMEFDASSPEGAKAGQEVTVKVRQQDWSVSQSNQSMRYTTAETSSSSHGHGSGSADTPGTPPLEGDTLSPQSMLRQPAAESATPAEGSPVPPLPRMSSGYGGTLAYQASLRGVSGDRGAAGSSYDRLPSPRFSYT